MKLSVILPCYNGASTIGRQLEALCQQEWRHGWELIVVDNGSTDGSMDIVERYSDKLPLTIVSAHVPGTVRKGVPHSYNTGITAAKGEAFAFCEADDEVAPGWVMAMAEALREHPIVVGCLEHRKLNPAWLHPPYGDGYQSRGIFRNAEWPNFYSASAANFGLRRSVYLKVGRFSTDFPIAHDSEYCWRAQLCGFALHFEPRAVVHYREKWQLLARWRQGRNWGLDSTRLRLQYRAQIPSAPVLRQWTWIMRCVPRGVGLAAYALTGSLRGRQWLADWVWNCGWAVGKAQALSRRRSLPLPVSPLSTPAHHWAFPYLDTTHRTPPS